LILLSVNIIVNVVCHVFLRKYELCFLGKKGAIGFSDIDIREGNNLLMKVGLVNGVWVVCRYDC